MEKNVVLDDNVAGINHYLVFGVEYSYNINNQISLGIKSTSA
jgi:hypothetical protein